MSDIIWGQFEYTQRKLDCAAYTVGEPTVHWKVISCIWYLGFMAAMSLQGTWGGTLILMAETTCFDMEK